jgi:hypothetical protein
MSRSDIIKEIERIYDKSEVNGVVDTMEFGKKCYDQAIKEVLEKIEEVLPNEWNLVCGMCQTPHRFNPFYKIQMRVKELKQQFGGENDK